MFFSINVNHKRLKRIQLFLTILLSKVKIFMTYYINLIEIGLKVAVQIHKNKDFHITKMKTINYKHHYYNLKIQCFPKE